MKPIIKKLLHEFWLAKGKFVLCVVASAVAGWGISSVSYSYLMSERDFHYNLVSTYPADFALTINGYNESIYRALAGHENVEDLERRELVLSRVKDSRGAWMSLILFAAEDLGNQKMDKFRITEQKEGIDPFILIERNASDFLDYFSDTAYIKFGPDLVDIKLAKAGIVHDARQAPARMERVVYGYTQLSTVDSLLSTNRVRLLVRTKGTVYTKKAMEQLVDRLRMVVASKNGSIANAEIPIPGEHIHQPIVDGISFLQESFGSVLIVLGIVLLSLILLAWLIPQLLHIGIMKAIGASTNQIYLAYIFVLLLIVSLGLSIGVPLGHKSASLFNQFIAIVQNFEVVTESFPFYLHLIVIVVAGSIPMIFGIIPVRRVARITVRESFTTTFLSTNVGMVRYIQGIIGTAKLRYSSSNLLRNGMRSSLLTALMAMGIALFFTGFNLSYSFRSDFENYFKSTNYEVSVVLADTTRQRLSFLEANPDIESVSYIKSTRLSYLVPDTKKVESALVRFYPSDYVLNPKLVLEGEFDATCNDCVFIHPNMAKAGFKTASIGDAVKLYDSKGDTTVFKYAGVIKEMGQIQGGGLLMVFPKGQNDVFRTVAIDIAEGVEVLEARKSIESSLKTNQVKFSSISDVETGLEVAYGHFSPTYLIVKGMGLFTIVVACFGMLIVLNLTIKERTLEIGIVKALGGSVNDMSKLLSVEFLSLSIVALGLGFFISMSVTGSLCLLYGEMVRGQGIPPLLNYNIIIASVGGLLLLQSVLIYRYSRVMIRRTSNALLNYVG